MRIRTLLPTAALIAAVALGATACEAGIEDKDKASASTPSQTTGQPSGPGSTTAPQTTPTTGGTATPAQTPGAPATSGTPKQPATTAPTGSATPPAKPGGTGPIVVSASGTQAPVDCTGRDVRVEGSDLTMTFTGTCGTLTVSGDDNSLETGWFDQMNVTGSNNLVLYGLKPDGTAPTANDTGTSNRILKK